MTGCLGKSVSKGEFVRRITSEQEVVIKDTPGAGRTFFCPYPCTLVLELSRTRRDSPILLTRWRQTCPISGAALATVPLTPGHSGTGLAFPEGLAQGDTERYQSWLQRHEKLQYRPVPLVT